MVYKEQQLPGAQTASWGLRFIYLVCVTIVRGFFLALRPQMSASWMTTAALATWKATAERGPTCQRRVSVERKEKEHWLGPFGQTSLTDSVESTRKGGECTSEVQGEVPNNPQATLYVEH